jgi:hypothetical protein
MTLRKRTLALLIAAALTPQFAATAYAQAPGYAPPPAQAPARAYTQAELDQMLAPIALYPDPLLSQILMAATYPLEVSEAARWSRANPGLQGDDAVRAAEQENWDPSVKSLTAFPQLLQRMGEKSDWTRDLGDAFLAQEAQVMDTVQQLRRRAQAAGTLQSGEQIAVQQQGQIISVLPASPAVVYVPYYDPWVAYGSWWWPAFPPVVWAPWPGYASYYRPGLRVGFWWGAPVGLSVNFFFGNFDWQRRAVRVVRPTVYYYRAPLVVNRAAPPAPGRWQHDPAHRQSVSYRAPEVQRRYEAYQPRRMEDQRREERRHPEERHQVLSRPVPPAKTEQPQARPQPQTQPRPQVRQEERPRMPEATAPQQPRAQRNEARQERRDEQRQERGNKGKDRS